MCGRPGGRQRCSRFYGRHRRIFAYFKVTGPYIRVIPVVLGIANFILGPMLGVFLIGMFTKGRGSDRGNMLAVTLGLFATIVLGNILPPVTNLVTAVVGPLPKVQFTWFALIGASVVFADRRPLPDPAGSTESRRQEGIRGAGGGGCSDGAARIVLTCVDLASLQRMMRTLNLARASSGRVTANLAVGSL